MTVKELREVIDEYPEDTQIYFSVINDSGEPFDVNFVDGYGSDDKIIMACYPSKDYFDSMKFIDLDAIVSEITGEIAVSVNKILNDKLGEI